MASRKAATSRPRAQPTFDRDDAIALAQTVTGSRQQFADAFRHAQAGRPDVLELEALASNLPDRIAALAQGFLRAAEGGWFADLCVACLEHRIVGAAFAGAAAAASDDSRLAKLQQLVDAHLGIQSAGLLMNRLPLAVRQVCQIELYSPDTGWKPKGTGFLVRSDLVMTAYHVVKPLLTGDNEASPGSAGRLRVRFDYAQRKAPSGEVTLSEGLVCRVADPWLVKTSACTADELLESLPQNEDKLDGFWDFAVLRLAEVPGVARAGLEISDAPVAPGHRLTILQHPQARPVGYAMSTVRRFLGTGGFRIVHAVNTEDGSSGSPCLNDDFKVVGLHQAAMPNQPQETKEKENRAVPMDRILGTWELKDAPAPGQMFGRLLAIDTKERQRHPLFGRARLQEWVGRSAAGGGATAGNQRDRFLVVSGPRGSGKSFTIDVLRAMLPAGEHSVLECKTSDFNHETTALGFAAKYLLDPLGADASGLPGLAQADTSDNAWLNYQLIADLLNVMDQSRKNRMVWIALDELDEVVLPDQGQVRKLLDLLYARAERTPWLRFVLLGVEAVPATGAAAFTERDFPGPQTEAALATDVGDYLMRLLDNRGIFVDEPFVRGTAGTAVMQAVASCGGLLDDPNLMSKVVDAVIRFEQVSGLRSGGTS